MGIPARNCGGFSTPRSDSARESETTWFWRATGQTTRATCRRSIDGAGSSGSGVRSNISTAFPTWDRDRKDPTHINSIHELQPNRLFAGGDERFRPGNILVSARHLNAIFIIDKTSGQVVWQYNGDLDYQHEATMVAKGEPGEGQILVFNNGRHDRNGYRRSLIQSIEPSTGELVWQYGSQFFFSSVAGTVQKLPGANFVIASSHGGRIFEITPKGEIVWEWVPPYMPMRPERLTYDHCPQLAALAHPEETGVLVEGDTRPYVDIDLYRFALTEEFMTRDLAGFSRRLLRGLNECRELRIPPGAEMWVEFGIDEARLEGRWLEARFRLTVQREGEAPETVLDRNLNHGIRKPMAGPLDWPRQVRLSAGADVRCDRGHRRNGKSRGNGRLG